MSAQRLLSAVLCFALVFMVQVSFAQDRTVTGKVTDKDGAPVSGATVQPKGSRTGTATKSDGTFSINVGSGVNTLVVSSVGYETQEVSISGKSSVDVNLLTSAGPNLNEVVVTGYGGTSRKKDLTGSVGSVRAKDFNKGPVQNPDQLLQGRVAGLQVINSSGQPGAATIVQIRGNNSIRTGNNPLYVIDGVPLDGRSPRPGLYGNSVGSTPDINPLNFLNPADISQIDVLKDASAAAIYGARGANGVILITTKKSQGGALKVDVGASVGISSVMRKIKILDASGYRNAITKLGVANTDSSGNVDAFKEIMNKGAATQNYTLSLNGGTDNAKYHASFLASDQQGLVRKSGLKKYIGNFAGQFKLLQSKLTMDFNVTAASLVEEIAPVSKDAGSEGNLISLALNWNPTLTLKRASGLYNQTNPSGQGNPLAESDANNDHSRITELLANFSLAYKITEGLEYRFLYGINNGTGVRKQEMQGWYQGNRTFQKGFANVSSSELTSQTLTHTLSYNKKLTSMLNLSAMIGYEYWKTNYEGNLQFTYGFDLNQSQSAITPNYHYYDNIQAGNPANFKMASFKDPSVELQSYFGRAILNYNDKYLLTATLRADGSSKFGKNNKYAYFPSVAVAWNIMNEDFMKSQTFFNQLKLRAGYGQTGNQEFNPVDAALPVAIYNGYQSLSPIHFGNPDLKWETVSSINIGLDFNILKSRVWGFVDYFSKRTNDPILDFAISQPTAGSGTIYKNLDGTQAQKGWVTNQGVEFTAGASIIQKRDIKWEVSFNTTMVKNMFHSPSLKGVLVKKAGPLYGQGTTDAFAQAIQDGHPINVYYLPEFKGFVSGIGQYSTDPIFAGSANPKLYLGFSTNLDYKKFTLGINMHGAFGHKLYNNTNMSVLNISNLGGGKNILASLVTSGESSANAITPSTRFLEKGDFLKMGNATITYRYGNLGKSIKNLNIYISGYNLFVISKYSGFDPEVNNNVQLNGVPALGIDYIGYPSARTYTLGVNFSLN